MKTEHQTRKSLLEAALRTFSETSYEAATVEMITARAGVSRASINYHFRSKEDLFIAALERALEHAADWIDDLCWQGQSEKGLMTLFTLWNEQGLAAAAAQLLLRSQTSVSDIEQKLVAPTVSARREKLAVRLNSDTNQASPTSRARARLIWALWLDHLRNPLTEDEAYEIAMTLSARP